MRELLIYLKDYKKESMIGPLFKLLEASFELIVPLVMAGIIDIGIRQEDSKYIFKMAGIMVLLGVLGLLCSITAQYFAAKAAMGFGTQLRNALYAHINRFSYTEIDAIGTSTLITRLTSDVNQVQTGVNLVLRLFLRSPFIVIGAVIMAFFINVKITIIFLITVPLISLAIYAIIRITIPLYKKVQNQLDKVSFITRENLMGVRVIRAFSRQEDEIKRFQQAGDLLATIQIGVGKISALMNPITYVLVNLAIITIIWYGGFEVYEGIITQGQLMALVNYMSQILLALVALAILIVNFTKATASAIRVNEIFHQTSTLVDNNNKLQREVKKADKIVFDQVCFSYKDSKEESLSNISFSVEPGQTVGVIGGTGSGKSTLINLIPRFYDVKSGTILVDGIEVTKYPFQQLRNKIGIVPQKAVLFGGTIRENMQWRKKNATEEEIKDALEIAQAKEFVDTKEEGLDTIILQGGKNLSGGQKQRLTIARALVGKPEILILDDSASALDYATDAKLRAALGHSIKNTTIFLVSQRAATIKQADKIIVLDDGKMVGCGTHKQLLESCEVYQEICYSQFSKEEE